MASTKIKQLQLTLAILKPHVIKAPHVLQDIQNMILENQFSIVQTKVGILTSHEAHQFYDEHKTKFFFNRLVSFMCSGPCHIHILARTDAISLWRKMLGPTKTFKTVFSHPTTIRGLHGLTDTRNAGHGSGKIVYLLATRYKGKSLRGNLIFILDSCESAAKEIGVFFPEFSISWWYENFEDKFISRQLYFDKSQFVHIPL